MSGRSRRAAVVLLLWMLSAVLFVVRPAFAQPAYAPVLPGTLLDFPRDTGAHPDFRTEWWYITGWLEDAAGRERGFQVTFFRVRTLEGEDNPSRFAPRQLLLAHAAIADPQHGRLRHAERSARAMAPLAHFSQARTEVWVGDWTLALEGEDTYRARIAADDFAFDLALRAPAPPLLNGQDGFSRKAPDPLNASYYYSRPQLAVSGTLKLDGTALPVTGHAWLDHEWSSEILPPEAQGWDWIGVNLADGGSLMAFQMRGHDGSPIWLAATLVTGDGTRSTYGEAEVRFVPLRHWVSPRSGARYPVEWRVEVGTRVFTLAPMMDDQELDSRRSTGAIYWEGAVRLRDAAGKEAGRGYLEMTGYAERLRM